MKLGDKVKFDTNKGNKSGVIQQINNKTIWASIKNKTIKRHIIKHNVKKS